VAIVLARQGVTVDLAGCVGADASADLLRACLRDAGVDCDRLITVPDRPTSKTVILLVDGQDRRYIHMFGANTAFSPRLLDRSWLASLGVFYLGGLFAMPGVDLADLAAVLEFCQAQGVRTVVDVVLPAGFQAGAAAGLDRVLAHTDYFLPNDDEAAVLTGEREPEAQARAFLTQGAGTVVITCGSEGVFAAGDGHAWRGGVYSEMTVVDPSGAGDAFAAGVVTGIVRGWGLEQALAYGACLGGSATRAVGTTAGVMGVAEAEAWIERHPYALRCL
jgi:sugar/nucleoside kinase (ribokinase family)